MITDLKTMFPSTDPTPEWDSAAPRAALRPLHVYLLFFGWTMFSVFLYARFSTLGDSRSYLTGAYDDESDLRTIVIQKIANTIFSIVHVELIAHLLFAAFAATGVIYMIRHARFHGRYHWLLLALLFTPNFGVWASVVGREAIFVGLMGLFLGAVLAYWHRPAFHQLLLALSCVAGMIFIRAPYGVGVALFFLMFLLYRSGPRMYLSTGVQALLFIVACVLALMVVWPHVDGYINEEVLPKAQHYFTRSSDTTRTWVQVDTTFGLLTSLWWSLPLALIGPTPAEVLARPLTLPFFLSGVVVFGSLLYSVGMAFRAPAGRVRKVLLLGWLPAVIVILIAYVPFGIYNSGSAIRYASCFLPFLIFPSMLLSAVSAEATDGSAMPVPRRARLGPARAQEPLQRQPAAMESQAMGSQPGWIR